MSIMAIKKTSNMSLIIFKIIGSKIHLPGEKDSSFRIFCHVCNSPDANSNAELDQSRLKVFVLSESFESNERCEFLQQKPAGRTMHSSDLALFLDGPLDSQQADTIYYTIDFNSISLSDTSTNLDLNENQYRKIGTAFWAYSKISPTQGTLTLQIVNQEHHSAPVGEVQVEYLIVENPDAYGVNVPHPQWLKLFKGKLDAGHRGAGTGCRADLATQVTENTTASFNYAARHGADMCELDVLCTADGIPVVYHNYSLTIDKKVSKQIDKLTLEELRNLGAEDIHDDGCKHTETDKKREAVRFEKDNAPFPTLKEVLQNVDKSCALNIEVKWPQMLPNGTKEATQYREINDYVDRVLDCIYDHGADRHMILSTLNANIAILLRLKQARYAVYFVTTGDSLRFDDPITKTVKNAIHFAQAFDLAGINPNAAHLNEHLVKYAQGRGLQVIAWGKIETSQTIRELRQMGLDGVIYDKIDLIKPSD